MLVLIDPSLGADGALLAVPIRQAFGTRCNAVVVPTDAVDPGIEAVLGVVPTLILEGAEPPAWLGAVPAEHVRVELPVDAAAVVQALERATGFEAAKAGAPRKAKLAPAPSEELRQGLAGLDARWRIEVTSAPRLASGLRAELVADVTRDSYAAAADFARACATLADAQDHHPVLIHDWRTVTVRVATGEAAGRLTARDLSFAAGVDALLAAQ